MSYQIACSTTVFSRQKSDKAWKNISELGFRYVDLLLVEGWAHYNPSEIVEKPDKMRDKIAELCQEYRLEVSAFNLGFRHPISTAKEMNWPPVVKQFESICKIANSVGVGVLTLRLGGPPSGPELGNVTQKAIDRLQELAEIAKSYNTKLTIETHSDTICETYENTLFMLTHLPNVGITYDPSHFIMRKVSLKKTASLFPHIEYIHLRNAKAGTFQASMNEGTMDFDWLVKKLIEYNFTGFIAIEYLDTHSTRDIVPDVLVLKQLLEGHKS